MLKLLPHEGVSIKQYLSILLGTRNASRCLKALTKLIKAGNREGAL